MGDVLRGAKGLNHNIRQLSQFDKEATARQIAFKRNNWPGLADGRDVMRPDHTYPHILPSGCEYLSIYEPIALELFSYLSKEDIEIHSGIRNLKSSQAACFNILFPMKQDLNLAKSALGHFLPNVESVHNIEFEYTGPPEITEWLGEPTKGKRGQNRTSIDAAVFWTSKDGKNNISLIEWKYTERNFGACSVYSSAEQKIICDKVNISSGEDPALICPLSIERKGNSRRYWEHLETLGVFLDRMATIAGCPFRTPLYQIMRQCEIAAYLRSNHAADSVEVVVVSFGGNSALLEVPRELKSAASSSKDNIIDLWNGILSNVQPVRHITIEEIMQQIDINKTYDQSWRQYLTDRYGI
jgi:hypothetical protein